MTMRLGKGEAEDLVAVLIEGEKVPREIRSPQKRKELTGKEEDLKGEEEDVGCEAAEDEGAVGDSAREVAAAVVSEGSENLKEEAEVIDRKSFVAEFTLCS